MTGVEEAVAWFRADPGRVRDLDDVDNRSAAIAIVNAVLAGDVPAGRDLTAQDVRDALHDGGRSITHEGVATRLNRIARPSGGAGSVSPDDAPTTETHTEYRVTATAPEIDPPVSDTYRDRASAQAKAQRWTSLRYPGVRVEFRTVSTTTRTTAWKADDHG